MQISRRLAIKSIVAAATMAGAAAGAVWLAGASGLWPTKRADDVSDGEQQRRAQAFAALGAVPLSIVSDDDRVRAVQSMNLPPDAQQSLLGGAKGQTRITDASAGNGSASAAIAASATPQTQLIGKPGPLESSTRVTPQSVVERQALTRLAWLTLWDTDVEDGDAVRVEAGGYARTVTLTKLGITFAVPVPPDGQIRLIGVQDGDGGGITVGLASGAAKAVLPVMSVGEVLNLNVRIP
jgi:hypothetical protein